MLSRHKTDSDMTSQWDTTGDCTGWDWFDYSLNVPSTHPGFKNAMRLKSFGLSFEDAFWVCLSAKERAGLSNSHMISPTLFVSGGFKETMPRLEALIASGVPITEAVGWNIVARLQDFNPREIVEIVGQFEVDPYQLADMIQTVMFELGYKNADMELLVNAVVNGVDSNIIATMLNEREGEPLTGDAVILRVNDYRGSLTLDIIRRGQELPQGKICEGLFYTYLSRLSAEGVDFQEQIKLENPSDPRANIIQIECKRILQKVSRRDPDTMNLVFDYVKASPNDTH